MKIIVKSNNTKEQVALYQKLVYLIILIVAIIWCAGILLAPLWADKSGWQGDISLFFYGLFSKVCHQLDDRSLHLFSHKLGVCSRCTLIYFGFLAGTIALPFVRGLKNSDLPALWILFLGAGLVAIDAGLDMFDIIKSTFMTREITGAILGVILPFYIVSGFIRIFADFFESRVITPNKNNASTK